MAAPRAHMILGLLIAASFVAATAAPLLTYTTTLAAFGLWHVLSEMRYVHARFGPRLGRRLGMILIALLLGVASIRGLMFAGVMGSDVAIPLELGVVVILALCVVPSLWSMSRYRGPIPLVFVAGIIAGIAISPIHTILVLAILHNLTPVGFLIEAAPPAKRRPLLLGLLALFVGLPLVIATGLPAHVLSMLGLYSEGASILPAGPLSAHLGAYLPREFHQAHWAHWAFSALTFAQCLHYIAVIHVFPRLLPAEAPRLPRRAIACSLVLSFCLLLFFVLNFSLARQIYGIASAMHAWVEIPILLLALGALLGATDAGSAPKKASPL